MNQSNRSAPLAAATFIPASALGAAGHRHGDGDTERGDLQRRKIHGRGRVGAAIEVAQRLQGFAGSDDLARVRADGLAFVLARQGSDRAAIRLAERCLATIRATGVRPCSLA